MSLTGQMLISRLIPLITGGRVELIHKHAHMLTHFFTSIKHVIALLGRFDILVLISSVPFLMHLLAMQETVNTFRGKLTKDRLWLLKAPENTDYLQPLSASPQGASHERY